MDGLELLVMYSATEEDIGRRLPDTVGPRGPKGKWGVARELASGTGIRAVARKVGVGVGTVQRVKPELAA